MLNYRNNKTSFNANFLATPNKGNFYDIAKDFTRSIEETMTIKVNIFPHELLNKHNQTSFQNFVKTSNVTPYQFTYGKHTILAYIFDAKATKADQLEKVEVTHNPLKYIYVVPRKCVTTNYEIGSEIKKFDSTLIDKKSTMSIAEQFSKGMISKRIRTLDSKQLDVIAKNFQIIVSFKDNDMFYCMLTKHAKDTRFTRATDTSADKNTKMTKNLSRRPINNLAMQQIGCDVDYKIEDNQDSFKVRNVSDVFVYDDKQDVYQFKDDLDRKE